ncbi:MAG TPA: PIN domain nuclease [Solirubrobacterales bacterium]|nr:PIN domain nuclease [Solirubrobacterales bacterium]
MAVYLADTSAWMLSRRKDAPDTLRKSFAGLIAGGRIAISGPVRWELLHNARNGTEYKTLREDLAALDQAHFDNSDWERALDICQALAEKGGSLHRAPSMPDAMIAVAAERAGLTVLHYDKDFDLIAGVTGQPCEWVAPKGSL